ncbi:MAG: transglycosylase SLT domain-containing protein [Anaerolineaceae bacterium]
MKTNRLSLVTLVFLCASLLLNACAAPASPASPTQPATPTQTQTLTASATPLTEQPAITSTEAPALSEARLAEADAALQFGDYPAALQAYAAAKNSGSAALRAAGLFGQGLAYFKLEDYFQAKPLLLELLATYPGTLPAARANYLLAQIAASENKLPDAAEYLTAYQQARPGVLDAFTLEQVGDLRAQNGENELALQAYSAAYLASDPDRNASLAIKVGGAYEKLGQSNAAAAIYRDVYARTEDTYVKAQLDLLLGRVSIAQGAVEEGFGYYQHAVNNYPETYDAFSAVLALLEAEQTVDELQRGLVNYFRGQYDLANEAFSRYLEGDGLEKDKALYYQALAVRAKGLELAALNSEERFALNQRSGTIQDQTAIALWKQLVSDYPRSSYLSHAIEDIVYTQYQYMNRTDLAAQSALDYVSQQPQAVYAPGLLFTAGRYLEIQGKLEEAAQVWDRIAMNYPSSEQSFQGAFFAGILHFRRGDLTSSAASLNRAILLALEPLESAGAYLWLGKVSQTQGDTTKAQEYWNSAAAADPAGYYGLRARELAEGRQAFESPQTMDLRIDLSNAREVAAAWMRTSFNLPPQIDLDYSAELWNDARFVRAQEYWSLGLYTQARQEFESLRMDNRLDVVNSFRLLKAFLDYGFYASAIETSQTIATLAGYSDIALAENLPAYFSYVTYGAYYLPWVQDAAETYGVPVLVLYSLIHQESRFQPFAESSAGAQGLLQLMPQTAATIATEINYPPNFSTEDLGVPLYNLTLGTNYLARQYFVFNGDPYAALAAYNSGPGNVREWKEIAGDDPDLFVGSIRYLESRTYVRKIAEIFAQYARLYGN